LLTPQEIRAMALAELDLGPTSIVWDVCAGSGSVAIEAAQIAGGGTVYAIEMDSEDLGLMTRNAERFGAANLVPVLGKAPEAWQDLPAPDAVFVGGGGRSVKGLCEEAYGRLKPGGRLVVNVGGIEALSDVHTALHRAAGDAKVWMINIAHGTFQLERVSFEALNPTFLISVLKPA
jgi:precorrin-6Y C5,15-methyltransferase (decarboxylating)